MGGKSDFLGLPEVGTGFWSLRFNVLCFASFGHGGDSFHLGAPGIIIEVSGAITQPA